MRGGAWAVPAVGALVLVVAVVMLRSPADPAASPPPPPSAPPTGPATSTVAGGPPLTLDGWGSVRLGGPDSALSRVLCGTSWCPEPVVDVWADAGTGCVQRVRPAPLPGGVTVWVWSIDGRVEAVGVVGPPDAPQRTPLDARFGDDVAGPGDEVGGVRGRATDRIRTTVVRDRHVTLAGVRGTLVDYAEVATAAGAECAVVPPPAVVDPPRDEEPRIVAGAVGGAALHAVADTLVAAGWQDVSLAGARCRTWVSGDGAVAWTRDGVVVGVSAPVLDGAPGIGVLEVGQSLDDAMTRLPSRNLGLSEPHHEPDELEVAALWAPVHGSLVADGTPSGRVVLTTLRPPSVIPGADWPAVGTGAVARTVTGIVVGEECDAP